VLEFLVTDPETGYRYLVRYTVNGLRSVGFYDARYSKDDGPFLSAYSEEFILRTSEPLILNAFHTVSKSAVDLVAQWLRQNPPNA